MPDATAKRAKGERKMSVRGKILLGLVLAVAIFLGWGVMVGELIFGLIAGIIVGVAFVLFGEDIWKWLQWW